MTILDQIFASRAPGNGAKGSAGKGRVFCSRCGKRSHKETSIQQHIRDLHGGDGQALTEPTRRQMMRALVAAGELAAAVENDSGSFEDAQRLGRATEAFREACK